jgi:hypothetical protein
VVALEFESRLARRVARRDRNIKGWSAYLGTAAAVFLVINFTAGSLGATHAVIHVGTQDSVAKYLGQYDGKTNVVMLGTLSVDDWVCVKVPFKGRLSDIQSISFSLFISRPGGEIPLEPFVVIRMTEGRNLVCHPPLSYESGDWTLPVSEWQLREVVAKGKWAASPDDASSTMAFGEWQAALGNANVLSVNLYVGAWETSAPYVCYVGDLSINGHSIALSNAGRCAGSNGDMPEGF